MMPGLATDIDRNRRNFGDKIVQHWKYGLSMSAFVVALASGSGAGAQAQAGGASSAQVGAPAPQDESVGQDIVVTAQKRSERLSNVPLTISAASAATLANVGVTDTSSLAKIAPGFTATKTATAAPVYTLRGVGYFDSSLAATPAVTVYVDQIPLSYPQMTRNAVFDLERVEVLKGPQGTLFGQNSTGGAVNYIAAKPTKTLQAGLDVSGGSFSLLNADGFISGPVSSTLTFRLALGHESQGDWQHSTSRPYDGRGEVDITKGRVLLDWKPTSKLSFTFGATGWVDKSDTQGAQLVAKTSNLPPSPQFLAYPLGPQTAQASDWTPGVRKARDDYFYQFSLRAAYAATDDINIVSLTSYARLKLDVPSDTDGTSLMLADYTDTGNIKSFNQEVRAEATLPTTRIIVGGNYSKDKALQNTSLGVADSSTAYNSPPGTGPVSQIRFFANQSIESYAGFVNVEQDLTSTLKLQGAVRYTHTSKSFSGCGADVDNGLGSVISFLVNNIFRPAAGIPGRITIPANSCISLDAGFNPGVVFRSLDEHNVSFRAGPSWKVTPDILLYANVSKGYKAGTFPTLGGISAAEYNPTTQESVMAYEGGFKAAVDQRRVQLSGAAFYYDYKNKQLLGTFTDPFFGPLQQLVNIPKSRIYGAELQVAAEPVTGLTLNGGITYVNSKVTSSYTNLNPYGSAIDFRGSAFPFTPKVQATFNAEYKVPLSDRWSAFLGGNALYNSSTFGAFGANVPYNPTDPQHGSFGRFPSLPVVTGALNLKAYTTVDLRAGVETADHALRFSVWARNVTNEYYWTTATFIPADTTIRYTGMPRTFGATVGFRFGG